MKYIVAANPSWTREFRTLQRVIAPALPSGCVVHHVGSTAIADMPAKDIIDIDVECPVGAIADVIVALGRLGYVHDGDRGVAGREAFRLGEGTPCAAWRPHHLYACERTAAELRRHLAFRDYLRAHPARASWLAAQKINADATASSRDEYIEAKAAPYAMIVDEAIRWRLQSASVGE